MTLAIAELQSNHWLNWALDPWSCLDQDPQGALLEISLCQQRRSSSKQQGGGLVTGFARCKHLFSFFSTLYPQTMEGFLTTTGNCQLSRSHGILHQKDFGFPSQHVHAWFWKDKAPKKSTSSFLYHLWGWHGKKEKQKVGAGHHLLRSA